MDAPDTDESPQQAGPASAGKAAPLAARIGSVVFGLFWLGGVGGVFLFIAGQLWHEIRKPLFYKPVPAVVARYTAPETKTDEFGDDESTPGVIEYAYTVDGHSYTDKHRQGRQFANEYSRKFAGAFRKGDKLEAWYDPDDPSDSTLAPVAQPQLLGLLIFIMPFVAVGVGMVFFGLTGKGPRFRPSRRRGGSRGRGVSVSGGGVYFGTFVFVSAITAFVFFGLSMALPWKTSWVIGVVLLAGVVPVLTFRIGRFFARRGTEKKERSPKKRRAREADETAAEKAHAAPGYRKKLLGMAAVSLFWCGLTGVFVGFVAYAFYKHYDAKRRFAPADGVVIASKVKRHEGDSDSGPTYEPLVKYRYTVDGREYASMRYGYGVMSGSDSKYAREVVKNHPKGKRITVYYDPDDPGEAVLRLEVPALHYFLLLFLQPFLLVGLGLVGYTVTIPYRFRRARNFMSAEIRTPWEIPTWGTLRQGLRGLVIENRRSPLLAAAIGYGLTCFVSMFVVGIFFGGFDEPDPAVVGRTFLVALGVGGVFLVAAVLRQRARLTVDTNFGTLRLKSRKRDLEVPFARIDSWLLRMVVRQAPDKDDRNAGPKLAPLLAVKATSGEEMPIHVFGTGDKAERIARKAAEGFASLTKKPFAGMLEAEDLPEPPDRMDIKAVFDYMREITKRVRRYADLT